MLDFPASPTVGQQFTAGGVTWTWDGAKWTGSGGSGSGGGGIPDAPSNGQLYGRMNAAWSVVPTSSGGIPDAPLDGQTYGRNNAAWVVVPTTGSGGTTIPNPLQINGTGASGYSGTHVATAADLFLNKTASGNQSTVSGTTNGSLRWQLVLGNVNPEGSNDTGSGFDLVSYTNSGAQKGIPLQVDRATNATVINGIGAASPIGGFSASGANLIINKPGSGNIGQVNYMNNGVFRWQIGSNSIAESGSNAGSGFFIQRFSDGGAALGLPLQIDRPTGTCTFAVAIVNGASDARLKENVKPLEGSLEKVLALQGVSFNLIATPDKPEIGLIAQDVQPIVPEIIQAFDATGPDHHAAEPMMALDYPKLTALLIEAVKTLTTRVATLESALGSGTFTFTPGATRR
jgi:hypothetical protein